MVPHPRLPSPDTRLDDDEVESQRQPWNRTAIWRHATIQQAVGGSPHPHALAMIDGLLRQAEVADPAPANLDDHQRRRRPRVDRYEIELVTTDMDVPGQDGPAGFRETRGDEPFGGITRLLGNRSRRFTGLLGHRAMVPAGTYLAVGGLGPSTRPRKPSTRRRQFQRLEIERVEHRVVGHDRHELA